MSSATHQSAIHGSPRTGLWTLADGSGSMP